ncbi:Csu type fimbrial protein [Nitrosomonas sp. ANs5]|uniref:Csu type fimbrial protein n=1 Tax=Nitrosomonas sp. ANs5 TaxID=3423941 RepID=UPI003D33C372
MVWPKSVQAVGSCTVSANNLGFGSYNFLSPATLESSGNVRVSCSLVGLVSLLISYEILLSPGNSGSHTPRYLMNGGNQLRYNLYTNAARTSIWGDGHAGTARITDGYLLGLLTVVRNYPVYGSIPAGQNPSAGTYVDTIVVTLNF